MLGFLPLNVERIETFSGENPQIYRQSHKTQSLWQKNMSMYKVRFDRENSCFQTVENVLSNVIFNDNPQSLKTSTFTRK